MTRPRGRPGSSDSGILRQRIVDAAIAEFGRAGFQGARIERIARLAGCSRPSVYFHFKTKEGLFQAALEAGAAQRKQQMTEQPSSLTPALAYWFERNWTEPRRLRLLMQEALSAETLPPNPARHEYFQEQLGAVKAFQATGLLRADIEPRHLLLSILALTAFPAMFPKMAQACLDTDGDEALRREWRRALARLAILLSPDAKDDASD